MIPDGSVRDQMPVEGLVLREGGQQVTSTTEARRQVIHKAIQARERQKGELETLPILWKARTTVLPVVEIPLSSVLLNHNSHRIKSDLESHDDAAALDEPSSDLAQDVIESVIQEQPGYQELYNNIKAEGQRDAGVITEDGILVNANRRAVALRDIDRKGHIKVAVLPSDASLSDIVQLELKLQMQQDFKQSYSFTNELLFIDDLVRQSYSTTEIARELRWKEAEVTQHQHMLSVIRNLQRRCGKRLKLVRFDENKREIMIELSKKLQPLETSDSDAAERLLDARSLAMLNDVGYELIREIDEDFVECHLLEVARDVATLDDDDTPIEGESLLAKHLDDVVALDRPVDGVPSGLDVLGDQENSGSSSSSRLLEFFFDSVRVGDVELPGSGGLKCDSDTIRSGFFSLITSAAVEAREHKRHRHDLDAPIKYLKEAQKKIDLARSRLDRAKGHTRFKKGDYVYRARKLVKDAEEAYREAQLL